MTRCENCGKAIDSEALLCQGCIDGIDDYLAHVHSDELPESPDSYYSTDGERIIEE